MVPSATVTTVTESPLKRHSLTELTKAGMHTNYSGSEEKTLSLQVHVSANSMLMSFHFQCLLLALLMITGAAPQ